MSGNTTSNDLQTMVSLTNLDLDENDCIHCASYRTHIIVKGTIYSKELNKFEEEITAAALLDQFKLFRELGALENYTTFST